MLNVGKARELCELYVGKDINPELFREVLNIKLRDFANKTGVLESMSSINSAADTQEYELPSDCLHVKDVIYDNYRAFKIDFWKVQELKGQT